MKKGKVLIVYSHDFGFPLRKSIEESLYCFEEWLDKTCYYLNAAFDIPNYVFDVSYDLIIYHQILISKRSLPKRFDKILINLNKLKVLNGYNILCVQDEHKHSVYYNNFINDFKINLVYTLAHYSLLKTFYSSVDFSKVKFKRVLPGYLSKKTVKKIRLFEEKIEEKKIEIGYRARKQPYSLGERGYLKSKIAEVFNKECVNRGLKSDISNNEKDTFLGFSWYEFLCNCKFTIGLEGGASIHDPEGLVEAKVNTFIQKYPNAKFEDVQKEIIGNSQFDYCAISPRSLECCATKTCQILIEGDYNGILKPDVHYIALKKDFSNIDDVFEKMKDDDLRNKIIEKAWLDVVKNGSYYYEDFVKNYFNDLDITWSIPKAADEKIFYKLKKREKILWKIIIPFRSFLISSFMNNLPKHWYNYIVSIYKKTAYNK